MARKAKLGSGKRFKALSGKLAKRGARNPKALAAYIGRKKYGKKKMAKMSAAGRRRKAAARKRTTTRKRRATTRRRRRR